MLTAVEPFGSLAIMAPALVSIKPLQVYLIPHMPYIPYIPYIFHIPNIPNIYYISYMPQV